MALCLFLEFSFLYVVQSQFVYFLIGCSHLEDRSLLHISFHLCTFYEFLPNERTLCFCLDEHLLCFFRLWQNLGMKYFVCELPFSFIIWMVWMHKNNENCPHRKKRTEFPRNHRTGKPTKKCYQLKRNPILLIIFDIQLIQMSNELTFFFVRGEIKTNAKWLSMCLTYLVIFAHRQVVFP